MQQGFPATEGGGEREEMGRELGGSGGGHGEAIFERERERNPEKIRERERNASCREKGIRTKPWRLIILLPFRFLDF